MGQNYQRFHCVSVLANNTNFAFFPFYDIHFSYFSFQFRQLIDAGISSHSA